MKRCFPFVEQLCRPIAFLEPELITNPSPWVGHIPFAFWLIEALQPRIVVELGTHTGNSYCAFCQAVKYLKISTKCYAVDTWQGDLQSGLYGEEVYETLRAYHDEKYCVFSQLLRKTFDQAVNDFTDGSIDLLHIDGLHTYEAVCHDFETWLPKLSARAVVLFHDTNVHQDDFEVWQFWQDISAKYPSFNFLHSHGLGVLTLQNKIIAPLNLLFSEDQSEQSTEQIADIREFFARLGGILEERLVNKNLKEILLSKDRELIYLSSELQKSQDHIKNLSSKDHELTYVNSELQKSQDHIRNIESFNAKLRATVSERTADCARLREELEHKEKSVAESEHKLAVTESHLTNLQAEHSSLQRVFSDEQWLHKIKEQRLAALTKNICTEKDLNSILISKLHSAQNETLGLKSQLNLLRSSWSWRIGQPLRLVARIVKRLEDKLNIPLVKLIYWTVSFHLWQRLKERRLKRLIIENKLFDPAYYLSRYPTLNIREDQALSHFLFIGANERLNPHPLFDTAYYLNNNSDVLQSGVNPLVHYLMNGAIEDRDPHPLFNSKYYRAQTANTASAGYISGSTSGDVETFITPLSHYLEVGAKEGLDPSPYFQSRFYLDRYPDVAHMGLNPLVHYILFGAKEGRYPNPIFDSSFYLTEHHDVVMDDVNPLAHYALFGSAEGRKFSALFDNSYYVTQITNGEDIRDPLLHYLRIGAAAKYNPNELFDTAYYLSQLQDGNQAAKITPLGHFIHFGCAVQLNPHPLFDMRCYTVKNPDVVGAGLNPLGHFLTIGMYEGRDPNAIFDSFYYLYNNKDALNSGLPPVIHYLRYGSKAPRATHLLFDVLYYIKQCPEVLGSGTTPLAHYVQKGAALGINPHPLFDTYYYVGTNPDVPASGFNPLAHYILFGGKERRNPHPLFDTKFYIAQQLELIDLAMTPLEHYLKIGVYQGRNPNRYFDTTYYLCTYPDVAALNVNPLAHYVVNGVHEGRNPCAKFDTKFYLHCNVDVAATKMNPLEHYLRFGALEGRHATPTSYTSWLKNYENIDEQKIINTIEKFKYKPLFSIVVPTYNTAEKILRLAIDSVRRQLYPHWELCIADDASTEKHVRQILEEYCALDSRIKVIYRTENGHISVATNTALEQASGDFICLMDHDDEIACNALYEFAAKLNKNPELDLIYSDEDKITLDGQRYEPFLKPDWSPDYLESCMYTAHFACYRTEIVKHLGGFREGYHGAQDYDFVLRFVEQTNRIAHVPKILYHWRAIPGSTAASMDSKDYVIDAAVRALEDRLRRTNRLGSVKPNRFAGCFDTKPKVLNEPLISIIIPSAGSSAIINNQKIDILANCIESIFRKSTYKNFEIIVVDNCDLSPSTLERLAKYNITFVHYLEPFNVAHKMNLGADIAKGEYLLFLNDDTEVITPDWLESMVGLCQNENVGIVGAKLYFADKTLQHVGIAFCNGFPDHILRGVSGDHPGYFFSSVAQRNYLAVTGACMLTKAPLFKEIGGFDQELKINYNDIDYCLKAHRLGYRVVFAAQAELYHYESLNRKREVAAEELSLFKSRWADYVNTDPYYSAEFNAQPPNFLLVANEF